MSACVLIATKLWNSQNKKKSQFIFCRLHAKDYLLWLLMRITVHFQKHENNPLMISFQTENNDILRNVFVFLFM